MTTVGWAPGAVDGALAEDLEVGLGEVEKLLYDTVKSQHAMLTGASRHLMLAGGKRFRPLLVLLAAHFGDWRSERVVPGAVVCELTHLASLYHDDVMDDAVIRRSSVSANAKWGNNLAILSGDFLFAQAAAIGVELGREAAELYTRVAKRLISGQFREMIGVAPGQDPMAHYLRVVADKTGTLIRASCELGGLLAGVPGDTVAALGDFGEHLGIAFQFADDLLDIEADADELGKRPGNDLCAKVASLPVLHLRATATEKDAHLLRLLDRDLGSSEDELLETLELMRAHRAIVSAREDLARKVEDCVLALERVPDCAARDGLHQLSHSMLSRRT